MTTTTSRCRRCGMWISGTPEAGNTGGYCRNVAACGRRLRRRSSQSFVRACVSMDIKGRCFLGDVTGEVTTPHGARFLLVRHFNGEPWPVAPRLEAVEVLER